MSNVKPPGLYIVKEGVVRDRKVLSDIKDERCSSPD
jgi:hypothetical protein